ncbi:MAG TPA: PAS domain S-box protein [Myxococcales bacterium]|nr:PAS domain S-box protein [Myxococcales bacterium]HIK84825.1 PAS domain S-box protein [Myxococcales bacterium]
MTDRYSRAIRLTYSTATVCAGLSFLLGGVVLIAWWSHNAELVQILSAFSSMQFNTGLCFVVSGLGLLATALGRWRMGLTCCAFLSLVGLVTLVEYLAGADFGIDQLSMTPFTTVETHFPGRMAPDTAVGFVLVAIALGMLAMRSDSEKIVGIGAIAGSLAFSVGFVGIAVYVVSEQAGDGWTRMAIHAAIGFMLIGIGITSLAWSRSVSIRMPLPSWFSAAVGIGTLALMVSAWEVLVLYEAQLIRENQISGALPHVANSFLVLGVALALMTSLIARIAQVEVGRRLQLKEAKQKLSSEIHARRRVESALEMSGAELGRFLDNVPMAVMVYNSREVTFVSPQFCKIMGYSQAEMLGRPPQDLLSSEAEYRRVSQEIVNRIAQGRVGKVETRVPRKDGTVATVSIHTSQVDPENPDLGFVSSIIDMTKLRQAERARELLGSAVEQSEDIVMITDASGSLEYVNRSFENITGYSSDEILGQNPRVLRSGLQSKEFYHDLWKTIAEGNGWNGSVVNRKKGGELFSVEMSISPIRNHADGTMHYVAVQRDVTRKLELEAEFLHAQRMESIGLLAGGVAHDFNNLLTVILSACSFMGEDMDALDPMHEDLEQIEQAGNRAAMLTRQLLAFSRKQPTDLRPIDLNQTVEELRSMLRRLIGEHVEVNFVSSAEPCWIEADPGQIEQVVMNLVVNAIDAMPDGGSLTIKTTPREAEKCQLHSRHSSTDEQYVLLEVSDTGIGMDPETASKVFDPFFTTKLFGRGTGLGLSTVYGLVKAHGGDIQIDSVKGMGTGVKIYFPAVDPATMDEIDCPTSIDSNGTETVLLVEDDPAVLQLTERILDRKGYRVIVAADGEEGIAVADAYDGPIQVILTDVRMPKIEGDEMATAILAKRRESKVLFMSGYSESPIRLSPEISKKIHFLQKPFSADTLAKKVRDVLDGD